MRKRLIIFLLTVVSVVCLALGVSACGGNSGDGTYYFVNDGVVYEDISAEVSDGGSWQVDGLGSGSYCTIADNGFVTLYVSKNGEKLYTGIVSGNILGVNLSGTIIMFYREGTYTAYNITYNGNGGAVDGESSVTYKVLSGYALPQPDTELYGYDFLGWSTSSSGANIYDVASGTATSDLTLYASWELIEYTYTFVADGVTVGTALVHYGDTSVTEPAIPAKSGYTAYWDYTFSYADKTVYARYTPVYYTITYENTKGADNDNYTSYSVEYSFTFSDLSVNGYNFLGWYDEGGNQVTGISAGTMGNITLTAKWSLATYSITYENTKNNSTEGYPSTYTIESDDITLPTGLTADYYTFNGWKDSSGNTVSVIPKGSYGNITLTANFTPISYEITYAGVSSATHSNPANYDVEDEITLTAATRDGYTFLGWYNDSGEKVEYIHKGSHGNITLTAKWEPTVYTITYTNLRGNDSSSYVSTYTIESETIVLPAGLTAEGATFTGWKDGSAIITQIVKGTYGNRTLEAQWTLTNYNITYNGTQGAANSNPATYTIDDEVTLAELSRDGYTFLGWYDENNAKVTKIDKGSTGAVTLTASWEITTYTITYNNTKEADASGYTATYTIESAEITLPQELTTSGATFTGWQDANGNTVTTIPAGSFGNVTLTACWDLTNYTITYSNVEGATNANVTTYTVEDEITLADASKNGYTFLGWYDGNNTKVTTISEGSTGDVTLTAQWQVTTYTITYEDTMTADTSSFVTSYTIEDAAITLPTTLTVESYTFNGWKDADGNAVTTIPAGSFGNVTVYADLTPTVYTITLQPVSGSLSDATASVAYGESYTLAVPELTGYDFVGWYTSTGTNGVQITDEKGASLAGYSYHKDITLYARYEVQTFTVTFVTNGGSAVSSATYSYNSTFNPDAAVTTYDGYVFLGWYLEDGETKYTSTTLITSDVTLYASWLQSTAISDAAGFIAIADNPSANYHLTCDINLKDEIWTPISEFSGTLLGNGYKVYNFVLQTTTDSTYALFLTNSGTIDGITFSDFTFTVTVSTIDATYGIIAATNTGTISNCVVTGGTIKITLNKTLTSTTVTGYVYIGNICAYNSGSLIGCENYEDIIYSISVKEYVSGGSSRTLIQNIYCGGITGYNNSSISDCKNSNKINSTTSATGGRQYWNSGDCYTYIYDYVGGIVGGNNGTCTNSSAYIEYSGDSSVDSYGYDYVRVGGFVGINLAEIEACYSTGSITTGSNNDPYMGGFVGDNSGSGTSIKSCYSTVSISHTQGAGKVGGFVGYNSGIIQNSYAKGSVSSSVSGVDIAGFAGNNYNSGTISKCYCDGNVTSSSSSDNYGYFVGLTTGTLLKCYYLKSAYLTIAGESYSYVTEYDTEKGEGVLYETLWSSEFLVDQLYWDEENWVILLGSDPILDWELYSEHDLTATVVEPTCELPGYTIYKCSDCGLYFIRNYVAPTGHSYDEGEVTLEATCSHVGYIKYTCATCGEYYVEEIEMIEHVWGSAEDVAATCTHDAYKIYTCSNCGNTYIETLEGTATGHKEYTTIAATEPTEVVTEVDGVKTYTFTDYGYTAEIVCTDSNCDCYDENAKEGEVGYRYPDTGYVIIQAREQLSPEASFKITDYVAPTCTEEGSATYTNLYTGHSGTVVLAATGHTDADGDYICDSCGKFIDSSTFDSSSFFEISTADDLLLIAKNLNGKYKLTADIDLSSIGTWTPIGSESSPFTGYFYGNGYTISGLSLTDGGLFGYNSGVIYGVTVSGANIEVTNYSGTMGLIAAYNSGTISGCKVTGTVYAYFRNTATMGAFGDYDYSYNAIFGGIVGENLAGGYVSGCTVSASLNVRVYNTITITISNSLNAVTYGQYKFATTVTAGLTFGIVSGRNSGTISSCTITSSPDLRLYVAFIEQGDSKVCTLAANINVKFGVYAGESNYGTVTDCTDAASIGFNITYNDPSSDGVVFWSRQSNITSSRADE